MEETVFRIVSTPFGWTMSRNEKHGRSYETLEAALEVAYAEVAASLEQGLNAVVTVDRVGRSQSEIGRHAGEAKTLFEGIPAVWAA